MLCWTHDFSHLGLPDFYCSRIKESLYVMQQITVTSEVLLQQQYMFVYCSPYLYRLSFYRPYKTLAIYYSGSPDLHGMTAELFSKFPGFQEDIFSNALLLSILIANHRYEA